MHLLPARFLQASEFGDAVTAYESCHYCLLEGRDTVADLPGFPAAPKAAPSTEPGLYRA